MKRRRLSAHLGAASIFLLAAAFVLLPLSTEPGVSQVRFRTHEDDRPRLERYLGEAKDASTREEFERIVDSGRETLAAAWEREADAAVARALKEAADEEGLAARLSRERAAAFEEWERGMGAEIARATGSFMAARQGLLYADFDREELRRLLKRAEGAHDPGAWDELVDDGGAAISADWERALEEGFDRARLGGAMLEGAAREEFEREIGRLEREIRARFDLERGGLVYHARNAFISDRYLDTHSLRRASEEASAEAIATRIVRETEEALRADEEAISQKPNGVLPGEGRIDLSSLGENWRSELERLLERGLERWRAAQEELFRSMLAWKNSAEEAYDAGNAKWARAYDEIYLAREAWHRSLAAEIDEGLSRWAREEDSLTGNIETARSNFREYMETLKDQWDDHSSGLVGMASSGARVYGEAVENVAWLEAMCERYFGVPAVREYGESVKKAINAATDGRIDAALAPYEAWMGDAAKVTLSFLDSSMDSGGAYSERYRVRIVWGLSGWFSWTIDDFIWTNTVTEESEAFLKPAYYHYYTELTRWREIRDTFADTVKEAERYMHERNMSGWGEYGPGFLVNYKGEYEPNPDWENDPYLMTGAEREYALAERELLYWRGRLAIAEAVKAYAAGERGDAEATIAAKDEARSALEGAKAAYEEELAGIAGIVARLKSIQGARPLDDNEAAWEEYRNSIEYLSRGLSNASAEMEKKRETLLAFQRALIVMENGEGADFVARELREIEENLGRVEKELSEKRFEYYMKAFEAERLERLSDYASLYAEALYGREESKRSLGAFEEIVDGEETDQSLSAWVIALESQRDAVWGAAAGEIYAALAAHKAAWEEASADGKAAARKALSLFLRGEYARLRAEYERRDGIFALLRNTDTNVKDYLGAGLGRDAEAYERTAELNQGVFELIAECAEELGEEEGFERLTGLLNGKLEAAPYTYKGDNRAHTLAHAALDWVRAELEGAGKRGIADRVRREKETAAFIREMYEGFEGFDPGSLLALADDGDEPARSVLREYFRPGSGMAALEFIQAADPSIAIVEDVRRSIFEYASKNAQTLPWNESVTTGRDFSAGMLDYINSRLGWRFVLSEEGLDELDPEELSLVAEALSEYMAEGTRERGALPDALGEIIRTVLAARDRLDEYLYLAQHRDEEDPEALLEAATRENGVASAVLEFVEGIGERLAGDAAGGLFAYIVKAYRSLDEGVRAYLVENGDEALKALSDTAVYLAGLEFAMEKAALGAEFLTMDGSVTVARFVEARGASYGEDERKELAAYIEALREKRLYDEMGLETALMEYLEGRALSGAAYDELKRYALIDRYLRFASGGFSECEEPLFERYARYRDFEKLLRSNGPLDGEGEAGYAERMASEFAAAHPAGEGESYLDFAREFLGGRTSSFVHLPEEVRYYVAAGDYYEGAFVDGVFVRGAEELDSYIGARYGSLGLDESVRGMLAAYVEGIGGIDTWYGQETEAYMSSLSQQACGAFRRYLYAAIPSRDLSVLRPGFSEGVYGLERSIEADLAFLGGMADEAIGRLAGRFEEAYQAAGRAAANAKRAESFAASLVELEECPGQFESYRNYMINATGEDGKPAISVETIDEKGVVDGRDPETGVVNVYRYVPAENGPNGRSMLGSLIVEESNNLAGLLKTLFEVGKKGAIPPEGEGVFSIARFIERAAGLYHTGAKYELDSDGLYSFSGKLSELMSEVDTYTLAHGAGSLFALSNELSSKQYGLEEYKKRIVDRGGTYLLMGGDADGLRAEMKAASDAHEEARKNYQSIKTALDERQAAYEAVNSEYIAAMNATAARYAVYRERELSWEKAYSVWEYANTPYLKDASPRDSGLGSGGAPDGGVSEYDSLEAPDAQDVYKRVNARYEEALAAFEAARAKMETQETLARLRADREYAALRTDLERKTASFARAAQVSALVEERLMLARKEYEDAQADYERAREGLSFNPKKDGAVNMTEEETALRDRVLEHMIGDGSGAGRIVEYLEAFILYDGYLKIKAAYASSIAGENHPEVLKAKAAIDPAVFADMEAIYAVLDHDVIDTMTREHRQMMEDYGQFKRYESRARKCKYICNHLKDKRNKYRDDYEQHRLLYTAARSAIENGLIAALDAKRTLVEKEAAYRMLDDARSIADIRAVLMNPPYGLTEEDLSHLYDGTTAGAHVHTMESVNLEGLRKEKARTDADGYAMRAEKEGERIYMLAQDGTRTGESYALDDASVRLKDSSGEILDISALSDGEIHAVYDRVYSIEDVARAMRENYRGMREGYRDDYRAFINKSIAGGTHDRTLMLRDEEELYNGLLMAARGFGAAYGELRQRSFDGYRAIVTEMVRSADGIAVQQRIVSGLIAQNSEIQEKQWAELRAKFDERRERWMDTVGFIHNRGARDWTAQQNRLINQWTAWRIASREAIVAGEAAWMEERKAFSAAMDEWRDLGAKDSAEAVALLSAEETAGRIDGLLADLKRKGFPGVEIDFDADTLVRDALKNAPPASIGALSGTMNTLDTTAGFVNLLDLNSGGALEARYAKDMKDYAERMSVMQNLRVTDILQGIIDRFNKQLAAANEGVYTSVETDLRSQFAAPFIREEGARRWKIEVVKESNLFSGDKKKTIRFADYADYTTNAVALRPLRGLSGAIDFADPASYMNLDAGELEVYVRLASENLNREIEGVFGKDGSFSTHSGSEFERLGEKFSSAFEEYMKGRALAAGGWYTKGDFVKINSFLGVAALALGGGFGMALYSSLQAAVSANRAYDQGGTVGLALNIGSLAGSMAVQAFTAGVLSFELSYTRDGGFGGSVSAGKAYGANTTVGYSAKSGMSVAAGYTLGDANSAGLGIGVSYSKEQGFGGSVSVPVGGAFNFGLSYTQKGGFDVNAGLKTGYGTASLSVKLDNRAGFEGFNAEYTASKKEAGRFGGSQTFGFGYDKNTGYSIINRTGITYGSDWRNMDLNGTMSTTYSFDKSGRFTGSMTDTKFSSSYNDDRAAEQKRLEEASKAASFRERGLSEEEIRSELEREARQRRDEMGMMEKAGDMIAGAWLSMNNTLGQWGRDVAGKVREFGERTGNLFAHGQFAADSERTAMLMQYLSYQNNPILMASAGDGSDYATQLAMQNLGERQQFMEKFGDVEDYKDIAMKIATEAASGEYQKQTDMIDAQKYWREGQLKIETYDLWHQVSIGKGGEISVNDSDTAKVYNQISEGYKLATANAWGSYVKSQVIENLRGNGNNGYESVLHGAALVIPGHAWENARNANTSIQQVFEKMDPLSMNLISNMILENDVSKIDFNGLYRPGDYPHNAGLGIDIREIVSSYGTATFNNENGENENDFTMKISNWVKNQSYVYEVLTPWHLKYWNSNKWIDNNWRKSSDPKKGWVPYDHRNHMHIGIKLLNNY